MSTVQHIEVGADEADDQRLDRWLKRRFPSLTQGRIEKLCRKGQIRVDGGRAKAASRIGPGQTVRVPPVETTAPSTVRDPARPASRLNQANIDVIKARVIFKDDYLIVLDKPAGLAVQGGSRQHTHLVTMLPELRFGREDDPRLVHRLDKDTSGVLVLARTGAAAVGLSRSFHTRATEKTYLALVAGRPQPPAGTIRYGLVKAGRPGQGEKMRALHPDEVDETDGARHAVTDYRVIDQIGGRAAWVALRPITGRTHQLRAHMAALGTPIAGDGKYGGRGQWNEGDGWGAGLGGAISRKLHLHAARLAFPHPVTGRRMLFEARLPEHMLRSAELLGLDQVTLPDPLFET